MDTYLILCETPHGRRYWRANYDPELENDRFMVLGPARVGPGGYSTEEEAIEVLADLAGIDLDDPERWWPGEGDSDLEGEEGPARAVTDGDRHRAHRGEARRKG